MLNKKTHSESLVDEHKKTSKNLIPWTQVCQWRYQHHSLKVKNFSNCVLRSCACIMCLIQSEPLSHLGYARLLNIFTLLVGTEVKYRCLLSKATQWKGHSQSKMNKCIVLTLVQPRHNIVYPTKLNKCNILRSAEKWHCIGIKVLHSLSPSP